MHVDFEPSNWTTMGGSVTDSENENKSEQSMSNLSVPSDIQQSRRLNLHLFDLP